MPVPKYFYHIVLRARESTVVIGYKTKNSLEASYRARTLLSFETKFKSPHKSLCFQIVSMESPEHLPFASLYCIYLSYNFGISSRIIFYG